MNWGREFHLNRTKSIAVAFGLWMLLAGLIFVRNPIDYVVMHPIWPRLVLSGGWAPQDWRHRAKLRLIVEQRDGDEKLILYMISRGPKKERPQWVSQLARHKGDFVTNALLNLARDEDLEVRRPAVYYLSRYGDVRAVQMLMDSLKAREEDLRTAGVIGLGRLNEVRALPLLMGILQNFQAPDVLSDFEILVAYNAAKLAGQDISFVEDCPRFQDSKSLGESLALLRLKMEMEKFPERADELQAQWNARLLDVKRKNCNNHGPVAARTKLLNWWAKQPVRGT